MFSRSGFGALTVVRFSVLLGFACFSAAAVQQSSQAGPFNLCAPSSHTCGTPASTRRRTMASVARRGGARYAMAKFWHAAEECLQSVFTPGPASGLAKSASTSTPTSLELLTTALTKFRESYSQRLTTMNYVMAGTAMAPAINKAALTDPDAWEKMVIRQIPRPSTRSIFVGDVVAFTSPLAPSMDDVSSVLVRRVAAVEGEELEAVSTSEVDKDEDDILEVPKGHCWVLADNQELKPPQVIDSRTFGFIPMSNIIGRVIYSGTSPSDSAPVVNNPFSADLDQAIIDAEVDPEQLFASDSK